MHDDSIHPVELWRCTSGLSRLSSIISRMALAPGFLDEPDASAFRLIGDLDVADY